MGLDMDLRRINTKNKPVLDGQTLCTLDNWYGYLENGTDSDGEKYSFYEWCGGDESILNDEMIKAYKDDYVTRYPSWDPDHHFGWKSIYEVVADWRKANQVHRWFVENVQDGNDDCDCYQVSEEQLQELLDTCKTVIKESKLINGTICNGYRFNKDTGDWDPILMPGQVIEDSSAAQELLPVQRGFFFGSYDYDGHYLEQVKNTIRMLEKILSEAKPDDVFYYSSSW